ncbi:hypothetical protein ACFQ4K_23555 [Tistrella bauzanensis]
MLSQTREDAKLSPMASRSLLDSLGSRLDESREISRYIIGLLIFLGLLGTFWGLFRRSAQSPASSATCRSAPATSAGCSTT